ncbi:DUF5107 domain-containing protein [Verminephrobacter aporrectodeae]|uniref:DUF5107 domain-containing protein n=1 Tax=Verminephrobacter aporrectodeae TaxID=1110389 RepID=UPI002242D45D|nr:DUF5107 domain-containing protein [Verminephrobacter aporrectodeae]MCW8176878.1 DUF5107 domain-containing protein [Verminephrobacter aporrectodeae subsp. tuberculatae]MCW8203405.1 DUF5107 domain-containing protein [Verminephrobacter aporrectodeae subsp. tuberculatae]
MTSATATTTVRWTTRAMPMSHLGAPDPLPYFAHQQPIRSKPTPPNRGLNAQESARGFAWGADSILPYQVLGEYDRAQAPGEMPVLEFSNGRLTALLAPHLGGRLLSLRDQAADRELLFANPVFQPANLGSLNAWFSGGVEWNGLIPGHTPVSCCAVFAGVVHSARGPVLRLYEFDRIVEATWQIDLFLPEGQDRLFVHGRIVNADAWEKQAYWWTNMAVPASPGMRVLSPADYAIEHVLPGNQLERFDFPDPARFDGSYPGNWTDACSVFFRTETPQPLWIAALDAQGRGLAHVASAQMQGRKFFYFGTGRGGQHWMDFLSQPGRGHYVEIQSGITPTQNQRFALPAHGELHWTEAYAGVQVAPELVHHSDYQTATRAVAQAVQARVDATDLAEVDAFLRGVSAQAVTERLHAGSAWGMRHEQLTGQALAPGLDFACPLQDQQGPQGQQDPDPWDELLRSGRFSAASLERMPQTWVTSPRWCAALERSADRHGDTWLHALALGMAAHDRGDLAQARKGYQRSLNLRPTWLGYRQRALVETNVGAREIAYDAAWHSPGVPLVLAVEIANDMLDTGRVRAAHAFLGGLTSAVQALDRVRLAQARLAAETQDWPLLAHWLERPFATVREGESLLDTLWTRLQQGLCKAELAERWSEAAWQQWQARHPLPAHLDFRMQGQGQGAQPATDANAEHSLHGQR